MDEYRGREVRLESSHPAVREVAEDDPCLTIGPIIQCRGVYEHFAA